VSIGVIIVAAGKGERLGGSVPKQLLDLGGRTMLQRSVAAFDNCPALSAMVVVLPAELVGDGATLVGATKHPCRYVAGGDRRQDSVRAGLEALPAEVPIVLIHDAARPFTDQPLIDRVVAAAASTGAAVPGVPARDTVKRARLDRLEVETTIPREVIWLAQTPQGFRREVLDAAVRLGSTGIAATDEAMLVELAGHPVAIVPGDERNMKITTRDDLDAARRRLAGAPRVGTGYDLHRLVSGRPLVLAGVTLPFELGPLGHSDGDVVCHALTDAILGAAGTGDIGVHFPNTDARWKDAAGLDLLARAVAIVAAHGWRPASVDVTVVLERPKVSPHVDAIRAGLASVLGLDVSQVSVKGKTNEGVDAVGRGEAIAAHALAVLIAGPTR
jgi:2-C-methyl-D-erythritol 4-phosphate cytidylyltransferase/2-C-methyl-D-erythritol 2,4-cyclodiphosphate synthase